MHLLSQRNRNEFLAVPQLVRFEYADGADGKEPTLLIKATTLALKYLLVLKRFRLVASRVAESGLVYGVQIDDDLNGPAILWSVLESDHEHAGMMALTKTKQCQVFLFNELAVCVAWAEVEIDFSDNSIQALLSASKICATDKKSTSVDPAVINCLRAIESNVFQAGVNFSLDIAVKDWRLNESHYITNRASGSLIHLSGEEGSQQEELALWLVDSLHPEGAIKSPTIREPGRDRELTDVLITYEYGAFLIESKTLSVLTRDTLPDLAKLAKGLVKHIHKAAGQLIGSVKNLRRGLPVLDEKGQVVAVNIEQPPHILILVPDLSLLADATDLGPDFLLHVMEETSGFVHILDGAELLRVVQAADMIASRGQTTTKMMAFDYYLQERMKRAITADTPDFQVLFRVADEASELEQS